MRIKQRDGMWGGKGCCEQGCHGRVIADANGKKPRVSGQRDLWAVACRQGRKRAVQPGDAILKGAVGQARAGNVERQRIGALAGMHVYRVA